MDVNTAKEWIQRHAKGTRLETDPYAYAEEVGIPKSLAKRIADTGAYDGTNDVIVTKNMNPKILAHEIGHANQKRIPAPLRALGTERVALGARNVALGGGALGYLYGKAKGDEELARKSRNASLVGAALSPLPYILSEHHANRFGDKILRSEGLSERIGLSGIGNLAKKSYGPLLAAGGLYGLAALLERKKQQREKVAHLTVPQVKGPPSPKVKGVQHASQKFGKTTRRSRGMAGLGTGNNSNNRTVGGGYQQSVSTTN